MRFKRVFLLVVDSLGVGEALDADKYNDNGSNTLGNLLDRENVYIPFLEKIGLKNTLTMASKEVDAYYTIARPTNIGKDSLSGHYEMMGIKLDKEYQKFYDNDSRFPSELLSTVANKLQVPIVGNLVGSTEDILAKLGSRGLESGCLIIYTTGDSNLEILAHEDKVPVQELYKYCEVIRELTKKEEWKIARITARPYTGEDHFTLTKDNRAFTLNPPERSALDILKDNNLQVISIGKINDIFNGYGITKIIKATNNNETFNKLNELVDKNFEGLCFANFPDTDILCGHKRDVEAYKKALEEFDVNLSVFANNINIDDLIIITADHGCDPTQVGFNHTRENVPIIIYSRCFMEPHQIEIRETLADIGATILDNFEIEEKLTIGKSFKEDLK